MANRNKAKGSAAERATADCLNTHGHPCERIPAGATLDRGDLWTINTNLPAIQVKNHARLDLAGWVDDVNQQARNAGRPCGIVIHKRRGKGNTTDWYTTMDVATLIYLFDLAEGRKP